MKTDAIAKTKFADFNLFLHKKITNKESQKATFGLKFEQKNNRTEEAKKEKNKQGCIHDTDAPSWPKI